jgi:hypothetical protein
MSDINRNIFLTVPLNFLQAYNMPAIRYDKNLNKLNILFFLTFAGARLQEAKIRIISKLTLAAST